MVTNIVKLIDHRLMPWQEYVCQKVVGSNPVDVKGFFFKIFSYNFLDVEFVHFVKGS